MVLAGLALSGATLACTTDGARSPRATLTVVSLPHDPEQGSAWFGWTVRLNGDRHQQSSYRLIISNDPYAIDTITSGGVDPNAWDSGVVHSAQYNDLRPSGFRYEPGTTYYWSVRVRDEQGRDSDWSARDQWTAPRR